MFNYQQWKQAYDLHLSRKALEAERLKAKIQFLRQTVVPVKDLTVRQGILF